MANWDDNDWWNKPQGQGTGEAPKPVNPIEVVQKIADERYDQRTAQYAQWAQERQMQLASADAGFRADKELAPYYDMARDEFFKLDQLHGQQKPVPEIMDAVKRQVMVWKQMGVQPPQAPKREPGFPSARTPYDVGDDPGQPRQRYENDKEKMERNFKYLKDRQIDLDSRRSRADPEDRAKIEELRDAQYKNFTSSIVLDR